MNRESISIAIFIGDITGYHVFEANSLVAICERNVIANSLINLIGLSLDSSRKLIAATNATIAPWTRVNVICKYLMDQQ